MNIPYYDTWSPFLQQHVDETRIVGFVERDGYKFPRYFTPSGWSKHQYLFPTMADAEKAFNKDSAGQAPMMPVSDDELHHREYDDLAYREMQEQDFCADMNRMMLAL